MGSEGTSTDSDEVRAETKISQGTKTPSRVRCEQRTCTLPGKGEVPLLWLTDGCNGLRIGVVPAAGAEMASLQVFSGDKRWHEILHRALDYTQWPCDGDQRAPLLWPSVGRSFTQKQIVAWQQKGCVPVENLFRSAAAIYAIGIHGFARNLPWGLKDCGESKEFAWVNCSLVNSDETKSIYPFEFELSASYRVGAGVVLLRYEIEAGNNSIPMPFSIGNHLCLRMPLSDQGRFAECTLCSPARLILHQNALCLLDGRETAINLLRPVSLAQPKLLDTVLGGFSRHEAWVEVCDPSFGRIRITQREIPSAGRFLSDENDVVFVFWGQSDHNYFCPEPWLGKPNSLNTGQGCIFLKPRQRFEWEITIQVQAKRESAPQVRVGSTSWGNPTENATM